MKELIEALNIFLKYGNPTYPTHCEHDVMYVSIDPSLVSDEDLASLDELGFTPDHGFADVFKSYKFGNC
jgi:hypothetical protein